LIQDYQKENLIFLQHSTKDLFSKLSIRFLQKRKVAYFISASLLLISLYSLCTKDLNQGVDFVGGRTYTVRFDNDVNQVK
jgi:SecD/SecF fusion protein